MSSPYRSKSASPLSAASSPHLFAKHSTPQFFWELSLALIPFVLVSLIALGLNFFRVLAVSISLSVFLGWILHQKFHRSVAWSVSTSLWYGTLFALLIPSTTPSWVIAFVLFLAVVLTEELFGGFGEEIFHPALVGYLILAGLFQVGSKGVSAIQSTFSWGSILHVLAVIAGGTFLLVRRSIRWEPVLFYGLVLGVSLMAIGRNPIHEFFGSAAIFLFAFFFISDPLTSPLTKKGHLVYAFVAAFLTVGLRCWLGVLEALTSAFLLANSTVPLMDYVTRRKE